LTTIGRKVFVFGSVAIDIYFAPDDVQSSDNVGFLTSIIFTSPFPPASSFLSYFPLVTRIPDTSRVIVSVGIYSSNPVPGGSVTAGAQKIVFDSSTNFYTITPFLNASSLIDCCFYHLQAFMADSVVCFPRFMSTSTSDIRYDLEIYNITSGVWSQSTPNATGYPSTGISVVKAAAYGSKFVFISAYNSFFPYDIQGNTWLPRVSGTGVQTLTTGWATGKKVVSNQRYILSVLASPELFDMVTSTLTNISPYNTIYKVLQSISPMWGGTSVLVIPFASKFIILNQWSSENNVMVVPVYDIISQTWTVYSSGSISTATYSGAVTTSSMLMSFVAMNSSVVVAIAASPDNSFVYIQVNIVFSFLVANKQKSINFVASLYCYDDFQAVGCQQGWRVTGQSVDIPCTACPSGQTSQFQLGSSGCRLQIVAPVDDLRAIIEAVFFGVFYFAIAWFCQLLIFLFSRCGSNGKSISAAFRAGSSEAIDNFEENFPNLTAPAKLFRNAFESFRKSECGKSCFDKDITNESPLRIFVGVVLIFLFFIISLPVHLVYIPVFLWILPRYLFPLVWLAYFLLCRPYYDDPSVYEVLFCLRNVFVSFHSITLSCASCLFRQVPKLQSEMNNYINKFLEMN
jgi:hypothetical protein